MSNTSSSFYTDGETYDTAEVTSNDVPGSSTPSQAPSSFYPEGNLYDALSEEGGAIAQITALEQQAAAAAATSTAQAGIATTQATTATTEAGVATTQAGIATTKATTATTEAGVATAQATIATTGATTATTEAGIATTQATNAANSATTSTNAATIATTQAGIATTQATNAAASATAANTSATNAASSATAAATSATNAAAAVQASAGTATPLVDGTAAVGTSTKWSHEDHKHPSFVLRNYISGLTLSTAGASTTFGIAAGMGANSTNVDYISLASAYTKTTSSWALGTAVGSLDTGTIAASTWYHVFLIKRTDTNVVDVLTSLSATAPTMPSPYTLFRRIGSMRTNASSQWGKFVQDGDVFTWDIPTTDVNATSPGTSAVTRTLTTPLGVRVQAYLSIEWGCTAIGDVPAAILLSDLSVTDTAPTAAAAFSNAVGYIAGVSGLSAFNGGATANVWTSTSSQIRSRVQLSGATTQVVVATIGWTDPRGKNF